MLKYLRSAAGVVGALFAFQALSPALPAPVLSAVGVLAHPVVSLTAAVPGSSGQAGQAWYAAANRSATGDVRWQCSTLRLVVNPFGAPKGALDDLEDAVERVNAVSGVKLEIVSRASSSLPDRATLARATNRTVVIGWVSARASDVVTEEASAASLNRFSASSGSYQAGVIALNRSHDVLYRRGAGSGMTRQNLYMHELTHIVGLGHSDDRNSLMYSHITTDAPDGLSGPDVAALRRLSCATR